MAATAAEMITRGHNMVDVPEASVLQTNPFVTVKEALSVINAGLGELHDLLVEVYEDWLTEVDTSLSMTAGQRTTNLPADFFKLRALFLINSGQRVELFPFDPLDVAGSTVTGTTDRPCYRILRNKLYWSELPGTAYQLELWHMRQFRPLLDVNETPEPEIPAGWELFVVAHYGFYLLGKEESSTLPAEKAMGRARQRIEAAATGRDASRPQQVKDTRGRFDRDRRWRRRLPYPRA